MIQGIRKQEKDRSDRHLFCECQAPFSIAQILLQENGVRFISRRDKIG